MKRVRTVLAAGAAGLWFLCATGAGAAEPGDDIIRLINEYRQRNGQPAIPASAKLNRVAAAHVDDLVANHPDRGTHPQSGLPCNPHSWSANGTWSAMCYTDNHAEAARMWAKPREIANYPGDGYEVVAIGPREAAGIVAMWQNSPPHNDVLLGRGIWRNHAWLAIGAAKNGDYSCAWFGVVRDDSAPAPRPPVGPLQLAPPALKVITNRAVISRMLAAPRPNQQPAEPLILGSGPAPKDPPKK